MQVMKQVNHVNVEPEILRGNWPSSWNVQSSIVLLLTLLLLVKRTSSFLTIHFNVGHIYIHYNAGVGYRSNTIAMKALKCKPSACFQALTEVCLRSRDATCTCIYVSVSDVNGNVYKHSTLLQSI